jgi:hypothetical protein
MSPSSGPEPTSSRKWTMPAYVIYFLVSPPLHYMLLLGHPTPTTWMICPPPPSRSQEQFKAQINDHASFRREDGWI